MTTPVSRQPAGDLYPFTNNWQNTLFGSFKPCPKSAYACFCNPCYTAQLTERVGDHLLTCLLDRGVLMSIRTKVRTAYKIQGSLLEDCYTTCCACPCAAMQIEKELDYRNVPAKPAT